MHLRLFLNVYCASPIWSCVIQFPLNCDSFVCTCMWVQNTNALCLVWSVLYLCKWNVMHCGSGHGSLWNRWQSLDLSCHRGFASTHCDLLLPPASCSSLELHVYTMYMLLLANTMLLTSAPTTRSVCCLSDTQLETSSVAHKLARHHVALPHGVLVTFLYTR
jgi:hypothetical protein